MRRTSTRRSFLDTFIRPCARCCGEYMHSVPMLYCDLRGRPGPLLALGCVDALALGAEVAEGLVDCAAVAAGLVDDVEVLAIVGAVGTLVRGLALSDCASRLVSSRASSIIAKARLAMSRWLRRTLRTNSNRDPRTRSSSWAELESCCALAMNASGSPPSNVNSCCTWLRSSKWHTGNGLLVGCA